ncbi:helix-turn-helix transcriptional regulator [Shewanella sp. 4t3-1-2LB]|uniref:AraC family transcriptional regulator n=1 Tax=Shewanella sp. 4t3-1-2LB TaxID=2817682 RepID=UPI001A97E631|nr:helix-turn-helix transcriptional regulator [Shewanella sp. 4t3-1-2LB]MBO1273269.1 helix-turn-helix transcriptional regulator [Shewanella sp. 4t3-1-2LB]
MTNDILNTSMQFPSDVAYILDASQPVLSHKRSMQAESGIVPHAHPRGQLLWAVEGILRITSENAVWVVPSTHAVWIPGNVYHQVSGETAAQTRNIYVDPSYTVRDGEKSITMLEMSPLMRELILKLTESNASMSKSRIQRLGWVVLDELDVMKSFLLYLPAGNDPRLKKLISNIVNNPSQSLALSTLAHDVGASVRTIERLFKAETGMNYRQWRSRFRLMHALDNVIHGSNTTMIAHELGYKSVSSFIVAFKRLFGCTPQDYLLHKN